MYHSQNFCYLSGASNYQDDVADTTDFCNEEIDFPVDANESTNTPDNKATDLAPFDTVCHTLRHSSNNFSVISSDIFSIKDGVMTPPLGKIYSGDNNSVQSESNLITPMINQNSSITKTRWSGDKSSMTGSSISCLMDASSYMMKSEGEDNKIDGTEDLERFEVRAFAAEQSQEHTRGTKPDEDDNYEQDNKKQRFAESNSTLITGTRQMRALNNTQKSRLFL